MRQELMEKEIKQVGAIFRGIEKSYDVAFGAGILAVEGAASPMKEAVDYADGIPPEKKGSKLGKAKHFLPKVSNMIIIFLNTDCDMARPNERIIDNNGDMEGDTSIFHVWFCTDSGIDDDNDTYMEKEEFTDEAINWLKLVYERIQNSLRLAWTTYGARPSTTNPSPTNPSTNGLRQLVEEGKMDVKTGAQERHTDWLQKVNMEQKNWGHSEKTQVVKEDPFFSLVKLEIIHCN